VVAVDAGITDGYSFSFIAIDPDPATFPKKQYLFKEYHKKNTPIKEHARWLVEEINKLPYKNLSLLFPIKIDPRAKKIQDTDDGKGFTDAVKIFSSFLPKKIQKTEFEGTEIINEVFLENLYFEDSKPFHGSYLLKDRINTTMDKINSDVLKIVSPHCKETLSAIKKYKWKVDKAGNKTPEQRKHVDRIDS